MTGRASYLRCCSDDREGKLEYTDNNTASVQDAKGQAAASGGAYKGQRLLQPQTCIVLDQMQDSEATVSEVTLTIMQTGSVMLGRQLLQQANVVCGLGLRSSGHFGLEDIEADTIMQICNVHMPGSMIVIIALDAYCGQLCRRPIVWHVRATMSSYAFISKFMSLAGCKSKSTACRWPTWRCII